MFKYAKIEQRYEELEQLLADPQIIADQTQYQKLAKEYSDITPVAKTLRNYNETLAQIEELEKLLADKHDDEFENLAKSELDELTQKQKDLSGQLNDLTNPKKQAKDPKMSFFETQNTSWYQCDNFSGGKSSWNFSQ